MVLGHTKTVGGRIWPPVESATPTSPYVMGWFLTEQVLFRAAFCCGDRNGPDLLFGIWVPGNPAFLGCHSIPAGSSEESHLISLDLSFLVSEAPGMIPPYSQAEEHIAVWDTTLSTLETLGWGRTAHPEYQASRANAPWGRLLISRGRCLQGMPA